MKRPFELVVVLVRSIYPSNIGASSRAMANMGATKMILIDPKCELDRSAKLAAATGQEAMQNHKRYQDWNEFYKFEPEGLRFAFTARDGRGRAVFTFDRTLQSLIKEHPHFTRDSDVTLPIYLIFGPEDWGLSGEDCALAHYCVSIPTFGDNSSLNLAQAVLIGLFMARQNLGGNLTKLDGQQPDRTLLPRPNVFPEKTMQDWLIALGMSLDKRRINAYTILKRMLLHNVPTPKELNILETVLQQNIRKLNELKELQKNQSSSSPSSNKDS